jgi:hypothetical protein
MSEPIASQSKEFCELRQEFIAWKRTQAHCKFMLAANLVEYVGKKTAKAWYQKYGLKRMNDYFAALKKAMGDNIFRIAGLHKRINKYHGKEKESVIEFYWIRRSTEAARQLAKFRSFGVGAALQRGDEKRFLTDGLEGMFWANPRKAGEVKNHLADFFYARKDFGFVGRLQGIPKDQPTDILPSKTDGIEEFLLRHWDTPFCDKSGQQLPPLCYYTDDALVGAIQIGFKCTFLTADTLRKMWKRLGLIKAKKSPRQIVSFKVKSS